ncbi:MAG: hypothetical protein AMXMBFR47_06870 [Planctomycetota bacterium]
MAALNFDPRMQPRPLPTTGLAILLTVAIIARLLLIGGASLVIENDSTEYLKVANACYTSWTGGKPEPYTLSPVRMESYGWLLGAVFMLVGPSSLAVLITNHVLGAITCLLVARIGATLGAPIAGIVAAIACALDPFLLSIGNYALNETLAFFLITSTAYAALRIRHNVFAVLIVGALLGAACLVRPAVQVMAPFLVLAVALRPRIRWTRRLGLVGLSLLPFLAVVATTLKQNYDRGVYGLTPGAKTFLWVGVASRGLLDPAYVPPRDLAATLPRDPVNPLDRPANYMNYAIVSKGLLEREADFGAWAQAGIRAHPREYLERVGHAVLWQLNWFPENARPDRIGEVNRYVRRLGTPGSVQFEAGLEYPGMEQIYSTGSGGWVRQAAVWFDGLRLPGTPQIGIFAVAVVAMIVAVARRSWPTAMIVLASVAFLLVHAAMIVPWNRYTLPMYPLWYAGIAMLVAQIVAMTRRGTPRPAAPPSAAGVATQTPDMRT